MTGDAVGMALIGAGRMGGFHLRSLASTAAVAVLAVADSDERALAAAASGRDGLATYTDAADALRHPGVESCLIATSTPSHPTLVRLALANGVHVLCEKPLALDPDEALALGSEATAAGLVLQVGFWRRFSPPWGDGQKRDLGRKDRASTDDSAVAVGLRPAAPGVLRSAGQRWSGGSTAGVHEFDLAEWLTGSTIRSVRGWSLPLVEPALEAVGDVDNLVAVLHMADDSVATVDLSRNCRYGDDVRTEILGSDGAVFVDLLPTSRTRLATSEGVEVLEGSETDDATAAGLVAQAAAFAAAVRGGERSLTGGFGQRSCDAGRPGRGAGDRDGGGGRRARIRSRLDGGEVNDTSPARDGGGARRRRRHVPRCESGLPGAVGGRVRDLGVGHGAVPLVSRGRRGSGAGPSARSRRSPDPHRREGALQMASSHRRRALLQAWWTKTASSGPTCRASGADANPKRPRPR